MAAKFFLREIECRKCGGEIQFEPSAHLTVCNYCGSTFAIESERIEERELSAVDYIVPFRISKEEYISFVRRWFVKGFFTRDDLVTRASITDITGIYLPFYAYHVDYSADWAASSGYYYYIEYRTRGGTTRSERRVDWRPSSGSVSGVVEYPATLSIASARVEEDYYSFCESAPLNNMKEFKHEYLIGFACEPFARSKEEVYQHRAKPRVDKAIDSKVNSQVPGDTKKDVRWTAKTNVKSISLYLPFWMARYDYKGKAYEFMLNGDTGAIAGRKPKDVLRILFVMLLYLPVFVLLAAQVELADQGGLFFVFGEFVVPCWLGYLGLAVVVNIVWVIVRNLSVAGLLTGERLDRKSEGA